jgi:putative FmdB family regulatory protein
MPDASRLCVSALQGKVLLIIPIRERSGVKCAMPIYEYQCMACERQFQSLVMKNEDEESLLCPECGNPNLKKLISRVAYHVSESDRLAAYDPKTARSDSFYKDTRNIGLSAKKRAQQMGVDLGRSFETKLEKLRTDPGSVVRDSE